jgi:hypothetical protein
MAIPVYDKKERLAEISVKAYPDSEILRPEHAGPDLFPGSWK